MGCGYSVLHRNQPRWMYARGSLYYRARVCHFVAPWSGASMRLAHRPPRTIDMIYGRFAPESHDICGGCTMPTEVDGCCK